MINIFLCIPLKPVLKRNGICFLFNWAFMASGEQMPTVNVHIRSAIPWICDYFLITNIIKISTLYLIQSPSMKYCISLDVISPFSDTVFKGYNNVPHIYWLVRESSWNTTVTLCDFPNKLFIKRDNHGQRLAQDLLDTKEKKKKRKVSTNRFSLEHLQVEMEHNLLECFEFALGLVRQTNH